jgi:hypothetical protein
MLATEQLSASGAEKKQLFSFRFISVLCAENHMALMERSERWCVSVFVCVRNVTTTTTLGEN